MNTHLSSSTLQFLRLLERNNNRPWFNENKDLYLQSHADVLQLVENLLDEMQDWDKDIAQTEASKALFRIYRDTRFSPDPRPYKTNFGAKIGFDKKSDKAGYYLHIEPGKSFVAGGIYQPSSAALKQIRQALVMEPEVFRSIIENDNFRHYFRGLSVENQLKRIPPGFPKDHELEHYLRLKQWVVFHPISDDLLMSDEAVLYILKVYTAIRPLNDFINNVLTF